MSQPLQICVQAVSWEVGGGAPGRGSEDPQRPRPSYVVEVAAAELEGPEARTVGWLKSQVEAKLGVAATCSRLFHSTHELADTELLSALRPSAPWERRGSTGSGGSGSSTTTLPPTPAPAAPPVVELALLSRDEEQGGSKARSDLSLSSNAGLIGLDNLGNSCFMNTGLQCLSHIPALAAYFLNGQHKEELNKTNPLGHSGEVAMAFAELQQELWVRPGARAASHRPKSLHNVFRRVAPHLFDGYEQQDVQEFLAFCLDALHEDLNRVRQRPKPPTEAQEKKDERLARRHGDEVAAAIAWMRYLERGKSFLVDLLQGQLRSSLTCQVCGHRQSNFDPFLYLSVPVDESMTRVTDAIEKYLEEECLKGEERWHCEKCKKKVDTCKKIDLWKLPPVLVLHLKRFEYDPRAGRFRKLGNHLRMPQEIDLLSYTSSLQREGARYEVVAVADHKGPFGFGHYTATCRVGDTWRRFNDDEVVEVGPDEEIVGPNAYVIFLQRCQDGVTKSNPSMGLDMLTPRLLRRQTLSAPSAWPQMVSARNSFLINILRRPSTDTYPSPPAGDEDPSCDTEEGGARRQPQSQQPQQQPGGPSEPGPGGPKPGKTRAWPTCFSKACNFFASFSRNGSKGRSKAGHSSSPAAAPPPPPRPRE